MDFIVLAVTMALSLGLSAAFAWMAIELVLRALWRTAERPQMVRVESAGGATLLPALSPISAE